MEFKLAKILKNQSLKPGHILLLFVVVLLLSSLPIVLMEDDEETETSTTTMAVNLNPVRTKLDTNTEYNMPIPGTRISMTCPEKFLYNVSLKKFTLPDTSAYITIEILSDKPFADLYAQWSNPDSFLLDPDKSMDYISKENLVLNGNPALLVYGNQQYYSTIQKKCVLLLGDENQSILVTGTVPISMIRKIFDQVRACIKTVVWNKDKSSTFSRRDAEPYLPQEEPVVEFDPVRAEALKRRRLGLLHKLPFTITAPSVMKLAQNEPHRTIYTLNSDYSSTKMDQPVFLVEDRTNSEEIEDQKSFSRNCVKNLFLILSHPAVKEIRPVQIDGLAGYELTAIAKDPATNTELFVYQVSFFEKRIHYIMCGVVHATEAEKYGNMLSDMAKSFRQTTPPNHL